MEAGLPKKYLKRVFWNGLLSIRSLTRYYSDSEEQHLNRDKKGTVPMLCESIPAENLLKFHLRPNQQRGLN
ncbi:hypothetical protein LguiB_027457 [Lonicera macranthoides]